jgi:hypothetical protein
MHQMKPRPDERIPATVPPRGITLLQNRCKKCVAILPIFPSFLCISEVRLTLYYLARSNVNHTRIKKII